MQLTPLESWLLLAALAANALTWWTYLDYKADRRARK